MAPITTFSASPSNGGLPLMLKMPTMSLSERRARADLALLLARYDTDYIPTGVWPVVKSLQREVAAFEHARRA